MRECPSCRRRLLSQASPTCNWCGHEIEDASYQQQAAAARDAFFQQQALHDAASLAALEGLPAGNPWLMPLDPITGLPLGRIVSPRPLPPTVILPPPEPAAMPEPEPSAEPEETAEPDSHGGRFGYLEL